jgi:2-methylcitrate dehydratase PrpD
MDFARQLAQFVLKNNSFEQLPADVVLRSKEMMINAAAVALAAAAQPEGRIITRFVQEMGGNGKCTIIGQGLRTSPLYAALANGLMVHLLDFDDEIIPGGGHPSSTVFPVVMALGEMNGSAGTEVLTAFALGCEVAAKLNSLPGQEGQGPGISSGSGGRRDRAAGTAGAVGAGVAAAVMLGLDDEQLERALEFASGGPPVLPEPMPVAGRALQSGHGAMSGIMAARLVQDGLGAARDPRDTIDLLDAREGRPGDDRGSAEGAFFAGLGNPYDIIHPGVTLKLYPCPSAAHTAIDAVLQLVQQFRLEPDQVASVRVGVTPETLNRLPVVTPQDGRQARMCLAYIVAATLLHGQPLIDFFSDAAVRDSQVRGMMERVTVEATETAGRLATYPSTVTLTLAGGRSLRQRVEFARGQPELPLQPEELEAKFLYCSRYILPPDHIEEAIDGFRNLENIQNITGMASVLGG